MCIKREQVEPISSSPVVGSIAESLSEILGSISMISYSVKSPPTGIGLLIMSQYGDYVIGSYLGNGEWDITSKDNWEITPIRAWGELRDL